MATENAESLPTDLRQKTTIEHGTASSRQADLAIIGAGLSGVFTLLSTIEELAGAVPVNVVLFDGGGAIGGVAYGPPSGETGLTITTVRDFLPESERSGFVAWLSQSVSTMPRESGSPLWSSVGRSWFERNIADIQDGAWEDVHVPRRLFGRYLEERLSEGLAGLHKGSSFRFVAEDVLDVCKDGSGYEVIAQSEKVRADNVVLALGVGRSQALLPASPHPAIIEDLYHPSLDESLERIERAIQSNGGLRLLAVGGNAACMELLYHLAYAEVPELHLTVLTTAGVLPFEHPPSDPDLLGEVQWEPSALLALSIVEKPVTASDIEKAYRDDLSSAATSSVPPAISFELLNALLLQLVQRLGYEELIEFANQQGRSIGRLQRRAGRECVSAASQMEIRSQLSVQEGRLLSATPDEHGVETSWVREGRTAFGRFDLVVNCTGAFPTVDRQMGPLNALLDSGLVEPTASDCGLLVGDDLASAPGLYVLGPMLVGNVINDTAVWHLEHCGRLIGYAKQLGTVLADAIKSQ